MQVFQRDIFIVQMFEMQIGHRSSEELKERFKRSDKGRCIASDLLLVVPVLNISLLKSYWEKSKKPAFLFRHMYNYSCLPHLHTCLLKYFNKIFSAHQI